MDRRSSLALVIAVAAAVVVAALPNAAANAGGSSGTAPSSAPAGAPILFPPNNSTYIREMANLTSLLSSVLGLPPLDPAQAWTNAPCSWGYSDSMGHSFQVCGQDFTFTNPNGTYLYLTLTYGNETGRLMEVQGWGLFGTPLASTNLSWIDQRVEAMASAFGIPASAYSVSGWNGNTTVFVNGTRKWVRTHTVLLSHDYEGLPMALGNEFLITFDLEDGLATTFALLPWFVPTPAPVLTPSQAYATACNYFNETSGLGDFNWTWANGSMFLGGQVYFALNAVNYSLVYQAEATYRLNTTVAWQNGTPYFEIITYQAWVDPYNGTVLAAFAVPPPPSGPPSPPSPPPSSPPGSGPAPASPSLEPLAVAAAIAAAILLSLYVLFLEPAQMALILPFLPLYFRLKKASALEHFLRGQVYGYVASHPGASYSEIRDAFSMKNGTATYHLAVLETMGFIRSASEGRHKRFFAEGSARAAIGRTLSDLQYRVLEVIREAHGAGPSEVARALGISRQRARYNLRRLAAFGVLQEDPLKRGRFQIAPDETGTSEPAPSPPS